MLKYVGVKLRIDPSFHFYFSSDLYCAVSYIRVHDGLQRRAMAEAVDRAGEIQHLRVWLCRRKGGVG